VKILVPVGRCGRTRSRNGLLLRRDIHSLFDSGYVTVTPEHRFEVSRRIREEFDNGKHYYALQGAHVQSLAGSKGRCEVPFVANFEVNSNVSVVQDEQRLKFSHPSGRFRATVSNIPRQDFANPFVLAVQVEFDATDLDEAKEVADERLVECLNMLALTTSGNFKRHRTRQIVDSTQGLTMRDCLVWADSVGHEDPHPMMDQGVTATIERLLSGNPAPAGHRALRWYRLGVQDSVPEDQFQCFWFALEILAEYRKSTDKMPDRCAVCRSLLFCEACKTHTTHKPYAKQAIRSLAQSVEKACDDAAWAALDEARNALMHGATFHETNSVVPGSEVHLVDLLGRVLFSALVREFAPALQDNSAMFALPSTYLNYSVSGIARIQTIVPNREDGDLEVAFDGLTVSLIPDTPPQSALPSVFLVTEDQCELLRSLAYKSSDHQDLIRRLVNQNEKTSDGRWVLAVMSTNLPTLKAIAGSDEQSDLAALSRALMALPTGESQ